MCVHSRGSFFLERLSTRRFQGAKDRKLIRNAARCRKYGDEIESKHLHDFQECACKAIFVDGGLTYARAGFEDEWILKICVNSNIIRINTIYCIDF